MRIIDNPPMMDAPCIGRLIEGSCAVGQFSDNCIYLIADENSLFAKEALSLINMFNDQETFFNSYKLEVVQDVELRNHPEIKERIELHGDNFMMQMNKPSDDGKIFIVAKTDERHLPDDICNMIYSAERIARQNIREAIWDFAHDNTDEFIELTRNAFKDSVFLSKYLAGTTWREPVMPCDDGAHIDRFTKKFGIHGIVTHKQRMEMYERFLDNLKTYHKTHDPKIAAELDFIISIIDPVTLRMLFLKQSPKLQEKINNYINPQRMAEVSTMNLEVRKVNSIDVNRKNDGYYRLFLVREYEQLMVHFSRKNGFILYLIYLLDRKKNGNKVDTLNISQYKELFGKLYQMVYGINGETIFTDMMKNYNANNEMQQKGLYTVLKSIRDDVGSTCERMQEPAEPFLLRDIASHLAVLPQHIILPPEIMTLA